VKVDSRNQTLILASERRGASDKSTGAAAGALKRASIAASQADADVVYVTSRSSKFVRDGLSAASASAAETVTAPAPSPTSAGGALVSFSRAAGTSLVASGAEASGRDTYGNQQRPARDTGLSSYLSPVEQYARTQRNLSAAPSAHIDVLA
jgi:hypothetical protein